MTNTVNTWLFGTTLALASLSIEAAGFQQLDVSDPGFPDLKVGLWYPSEQAVPLEPNTEFEQPVALGAAMSKTNHALIVLSHGFGGWYASHADTAAALADAGFIVAAPTHTGNTWSDMSSPIEKWALDRPRHVSRVIDHVLADEALSLVVDPEKMGVYGFSAGGFTALGLIGGVPDLDYSREFCKEQPEEFVCAEGMLDGMLQAQMHTLPSEAWGRDPRIKAAAIAAPGFGFAYTKATLSNVTADVQLWSGELDESVPTSANAASLAEKLPQRPETHWVENANHFAFMVVNCRDAFKQRDPEEYEVICGDAEGFNRWEFHEDMNREMANFFTDSLDVN